MFGTYDFLKFISPFSLLFAAIGLLIYERRGGKIPSDQEYKERIKTAYWIPGAHGLGAGTVFIIISIFFLAGEALRWLGALFFIVGIAFLVAGFYFWKKQKRW